MASLLDMLQSNRRKPLEEEVEENVEEVEEVIEQVEEIEESVEGDSEQNERPQSQKAKDLVAKINKLCEKVVKEDNLFKRHIIQFKINGLIAKLQREIDKQNIHEKYDMKRKALAVVKTDMEGKLVDDIAAKQAQIKSLQKLLRGNEEYDYKSSKFMYPKDYVEKAGGIDEFTKKLKARDNVETANAAVKMEEMAEIRNQLSKMKKELEKSQEKLSGLDKKAEKEEKKFQKEEKGLIIAQNNPFAKIRGWFKNATTEIKSYLADRKDYKELKAQEAAEIKEMEEYYKNVQEQYRNNIKEAYKDSKLGMKNAKLREFQEKSGILVSESQLVQDDNSQQEATNTQENEATHTEVGDNSNAQDVQNEPEGEEH